MFGLLIRFVRIALTPRQDIHKFHEYRNIARSDFIPTNIWEVRDPVYIFSLSIQCYYVALTLANRSDSETDNNSPILLLSSHFSRIITQGSWIWFILAVTFGHLLPRTPARIQPGDEKRGRWGHWGRGRGQGARGKGEKGRICLGEKGGWKKSTHPANGGRPVRLVLDLKPREYPPFFLYLYASPLPRPASHPPWRPFPLREDLSRRTVAITVVFAPLLRALPATVSVVTMYMSWDLYLPSRHTELSSNWLDPPFPLPASCHAVKNVAPAEQ